MIQPVLKEPKVPAEKWPKLQIFGVYDGHGGSKCAEYLKDILHNNVIMQPEFPGNIKEAIRKGVYKTDEDFLKMAYSGKAGTPYNKSGSCCIAILIVNEDIFVINVGDSRAISSVSEYPSFSSAQAQPIQQGGVIQIEATS